MKEIYFYRWGNLNPIKHKEARAKEKSFHIAPCVKGIYAFPRGYIERFLIGGSYTEHARKLLLDEDGKIIFNDNFWDKDDWENPIPKYAKLLKKRHIKRRDVDSRYDETLEKWIMTYYVRPKKFTHKGFIWHHLESYTNKNSILDKKGSWVKTTYKEYVKALHKCNLHERYLSYKDKSVYPDCTGNPHTCPSFFSKDHYEVFIEKVK